MTDTKTLSILREQLGLAIEFMSTTDDGVWYHDETWWTGDMPGLPELYDPTDWEEANKPVPQIWDEYLYELEGAGLAEKLEAAKGLPIADLLAITGDNV